MRYDITNIAIEDYLHALMPPRSAVLGELEQRAKQHGWTLVGPVQGEFLYLLARTTGVKQALEIGMTTGYAAIWLLQALAANDGHLTGIEANPGRSALAREMIGKAGFAERVTIQEGTWFTILPTISAQFDLIFLDVLRSTTPDHNASQALEMCLPLLRPGGLLVTDNVLCSAQVLEEDPPPLVQGIKQFNEKLMAHPQLESVIIPLRDGVAISRKKE
ncbi:MAG: O-methyltransferase [Chloroflexaceae bacterium]|jgi:predicted O-methyltransferase YrrM|nr:O-methyltransferase [Chloroflexaceae bacterium]